MQNRIEWYSNLKFLFLLFVFVGHEDFGNYSSTGINHFIYSWHMPGFALLSGYFTRTTGEEEWWGFFRKAVLPFLVAYLAMKIIIMTSFVIMNIQFSGIGSMGSGWYLLALAIWQVLAWVIMRLEKSQGQEIDSIALLSIAFVIAIAQTFEATTSHIISKTPFFFLGFVLARKKIDLLKWRLWQSNQYRKIWRILPTLAAIALMVLIITIFIKNEEVGIYAHGDILATSIGYLCGVTALIAIGVIAPTTQWRIFGLNLTNAGNYTVYAYMTEQTIRVLYAYIISPNIIEPIDNWAGAFWPWFYSQIGPVTGAAQTSFSAYLKVITPCGLWNLGVNIFWGAIFIALFTSRPARYLLQWAWSEDSSKRYSWLWKSKP